MNKHIYQPYTYLIGWTKLNIWYYGCRYAKGCHPNDFWKKYFTSSKRVKQFRLDHGEPDVIQVMKLFSSGEEARAWETSVLKQIGAARSSDYLNRTDGDKNFCNEGPMSEEHRNNMKETRNKPETKAKCKKTNDRPEIKIKRSAALKEAQNRPETKAKRKETNDRPEIKIKRSISAKESQNRPEVKEKQRLATEGNWNNPSVRAKRIAGQKEAWSDPEIRSKIIAARKGKLWVCNSEGAVKIKLDQLDDYLSRGYQRGRKFKTQSTLESFL